MIMLKVLKFFIYLLIILVIALGALIAFFDPNDFKPQIIEQAEKHTGRSVQIDGDIGWSLWSKIGLALNKTHIGEGNKGEPIGKVDIQSANIAINPLSLIEFALDKDPSKIKISGLSLDNTGFVLKGDKPMNVHILSLSLGQFVDKTQTPLNTRVQLRSKGLNVDIDLKTLLTPNLGEKSATLENTTLKFNMDDALDATLTAPNINASPQAIAAASAQLSFAQSAANGTLNLSNLNTDLKTLSATATGTLSAKLPEAQAQIDADLGQIQASSKTINLPQTTINFNHPKATGKVTLSALHGDLKALVFHAKSLQGSADVQLKKPLPVTFSAVPQANLAQQSATLNQLNIQTLEGVLSGAANITNFKTLNTQTNLKLSGLNLGLAAATFAESDKLEGTLDNTQANVNLSLKDPLNSLNGTAQLDAKSIILKGIDIEESIQKLVTALGGKARQKTKDITAVESFKAQTNIRNGVVNFSTLSGNFNKITTEGKGYINLPEETLNITLNTQLKALNLGKEVASIEDSPIPIQIHGPLSAPKINVDIVAAVKAAQQAKIDAEKARLKDMAEKRVSEEKEKAKAKLEAEKKHLEQKTKDKIEKEKGRLEEKLKDGLLKGLKF